MFADGSHLPGTASTFSTRDVPLADRVNKIRQLSDAEVWFTPWYLEKKNECVSTNAVGIVLLVGVYTILAALPYCISKSYWMHILACVCYVHVG